MHTVSSVFHIYEYNAAKLFTLPGARNYFSVFSTKYSLRQKMLQNVLELNYTCILCFVHDEPAIPWKI
jgi:hypothetical protein